MALAVEYVEGSKRAVKMRSYFQSGANLKFLIVPPMKCLLCHSFDDDSCGSSIDIALSRFYLELKAQAQVDSETGHN